MIVYEDAMLGRQIGQPLGREDLPRGYDRIVTVDKGGLMSTANTSHTTSIAVGGMVIAAGGVLLGLDLLGASFYVDDTYSFPFWGTIARTAAALALLAGFCWVALGHHSPYAAGWVRTGLIVFGAGSAAGMLLTALTADALPARAAGLLLIELLTAAGVAVAAYRVWRTQSGGRYSRLLLAGLAVLEVIWSVLTLIPSGATLVVAAALYGLLPILLILFGGAVFFENRRPTAIDAEPSSELRENSHQA